MATKSSVAKWAHPKPTQIEEHEIQEEEEEEEEALSLCDLPINNQPTKEAAQEVLLDSQPIKPEEDFDFNSLIGSVLKQQQMCAADDVFFRGQIIPLRHSVSSEGRLTMTAFSRTPSQCISRSESMDRFHLMTNSRSSSVRSLRSSSSGSSTTTTTNHKHKVLNQFHSHPSPSPQIRIPSSRYTNTGNRVPKSQVWSFFRVGLVQYPEIELQGLKNRNSSNKSGFGFGSRNSNSSSNSSKSSSEKKKKKNKQKFFGNNGVGFFTGGGCKCSVDAVETMPLRVVVVEGEEEEKKKKKKRKEKKQTASRHRTFEWLKELSNAGVPD